MSKSQYNGFLGKHQCKVQNVRLIKTHDTQTFLTGIESQDGMIPCESIYNNKGKWKRES